MAETLADLLIQLEEKKKVLRTLCDDMSSCCCRSQYMRKGAILDIRSTLTEEDVTNTINFSSTGCQFCIDKRVAEAELYVIQNKVYDAIKTNYNLTDSQSPFVRP